MLRQLGGACHFAIAEAGRVVVSHGAEVVGIVFINEAYALYSVAGFIKFTEDAKQFWSNELVAYHFS